MTADWLKKREREIREQSRIEADRRMADVVKNLMAALGLPAAEVFESIGMSPEDQARVKQYM